MLSTSPLRLGLVGSGRVERRQSRAGYYYEIRWGVALNRILPDVDRRVGPRLYSSFTQHDGCTASRAATYLLLCEAHFAAGIGFGPPGFGPLCSITRAAIPSVIERAAATIAVRAANGAQLQLEP